MQIVQTPGRSWLAAIASVTLLLGGAIVIGVQRASIDAYLYVSELGAADMPTAQAFRIGFVAVSVGIGFAAIVLSPLPGVHGKAWLRPSVALLVAAGAFLIASQLNCTAGCPALTTSAATPQDWTHVVVAVIGFVAGCAAMLECAFVGSARLRVSSILGAALIAGIATTGGLISLLEGNTDIGSTLEFLASGLGIVWLVVVQAVELADMRAARRANRGARPVRLSESVSGSFRAGGGTTA